MLAQVGVEASSKSAMKTLAPQFSALMIILRSTGPVSSTRRSRMSLGSGATTQSLSRIFLVSGRKSGFSPASSFFWRTTRKASNSSRRALNLRCSSATKATASLVSTFSKPGLIAPVISTPAGRSKAAMSFPLERILLD